MGKIITQERLKQLIDYDCENGEFHWKVSRGCSHAGKKLHSVDSSGYLQSKIDGRYYLLHRLAWLYVHGYYPSKCIDHINRNRLDNRICNLRVATNAENCRNSGKRKDNTSGITGVSYTNGKWRVRVMVNKTTLYLGNYKDIELAELIAIEAKNKFHGPFSPYNADWLDEKVA